MPARPIGWVGPLGITPYAHPGAYLHHEPASVANVLQAQWSDGSLTPLPQKELAIAVFRSSVGRCEGCTVASVKSEIAAAEARDRIERERAERERKKRAAAELARLEEQRRREAEEKRKQHQAAVDRVFREYGADPQRRQELVHLQSQANEIRYFEPASLWVPTIGAALAYAFGLGMVMGTLGALVAIVLAGVLYLMFYVLPLNAHNNRVRRREERIAFLRPRVGCGKACTQSHQVSAELQWAPPSRSDPAHGSFRRP